MALRSRAAGLNLNEAAKDWSTGGRLGPLESAAIVSILELIICEALAAPPSSRRFEAAGALVCGKLDARLSSETLGRITGLRKLELC